MVSKPVQLPLAVVETGLYKEEVTAMLVHYKFEQTLQTEISERCLPNHVKDIPPYIKTLEIK